ncbi:MAG: hypothetical protein JSS50_00440 [Proteobacteria bacterium]|nr:hypothetical protein [Pseudomonadota bacterium]
MKGKPRLDYIANNILVGPNTKVEVLSKLNYDLPVEKMLWKHLMNYGHLGEPLHIAFSGIVAGADKSQTLQKLEEDLEKFISGIEKFAKANYGLAPEWLNFNLSPQNSHPPSADVPLEELPNLGKYLTRLQNIGVKHVSLQYLAEQAKVMEQKISDYKPDSMMVTICHKSKLIQAIPDRVIGLHDWQNPELPTEKELDISKEEAEEEILELPDPLEGRQTRVHQEVLGIAIDEIKKPQLEYTVNIQAQVQSTVQAAVAVNVSVQAQINMQMQVEYQPELWNQKPQHRVPQSEFVSFSDLLGIYHNTTKLHHTKVDKDFAADLSVLSKLSIIMPSHMELNTKNPKHPKINITYFCSKNSPINFPQKYRHTIQEQQRGWHITKAALRVMQQNPHLFAGGIDYSNLPDGFFCSSKRLHKGDPGYDNYADSRDSLDIFAIDWSPQYIEFRSHNSPFVINPLKNRYSQGLRALQSIYPHTNNTPKLDGYPQELAYYMGLNNGTKPAKSLSDCVIDMQPDLRHCRDTLNSLCDEPYKIASILASYGPQAVSSLVKHLVLIAQQSPSMYEAVMGAITKDQTLDDWSYLVESQGLGYLRKLITASGAAAKKGSITYCKHQFLEALLNASAKDGNSDFATIYKTSEHFFESFDKMINLDNPSDKRQMWQILLERATTINASGQRVWAIDGISGVVQTDLYRFWRVLANAAQHGPEILKLQLESLNITKEAKEAFEKFKIVLPGSNGNAPVNRHLKFPDDFKKPSYPLCISLDPKAAPWAIEAVERNGMDDSAPQYGIITPEMCIRTGNKRYTDSGGYRTDINSGTTAVRWRALARSMGKKYKLYNYIIDPRKKAEQFRSLRNVYWQVMAIANVLQNEEAMKISKSNASIKTVESWDTWTPLNQMERLFMNYCDDLYRNHDAADLSEFNKLLHTMSSNDVAVERACRNYSLFNDIARESGGHDLNKAIYLSMLEYELYNEDIAQIHVADRSIHDSGPETILAKLAGHGRYDYQIIYFSFEHSSISPETRADTKNRSLLAFVAPPDAGQLGYQNRYFDPHIARYFNIYNACARQEQKPPVNLADIAKATVSQGVINRKIGHFHYPEYMALWAISKNAPYTKDLNKDSEIPLTKMRYLNQWLDTINWHHEQNKFQLLDYTQLKEALAKANTYEEAATNLNALSPLVQPLLTKAPTLSIKHLLEADGGMTINGVEFAAWWASRSAKSKQDKEDWVKQEHLFVSVQRDFEEICTNLKLTINERSMFGERLLKYAAKDIVRNSRVQINSSSVQQEVAIPEDLHEKYVDLILDYWKRLFAGFLQPWVQDKEIIANNDPSLIEGDITSIVYEILSHIVDREDMAELKTRRKADAELLQDMVSKYSPMVQLDSSAQPQLSIRTICKAAFDGWVKYSAEQDKVKDMLITAYSSIPDEHISIPLPSGTLVDCLKALPNILYGLQAQLNDYVALLPGEARTQVLNSIAEQTIKGICREIISKIRISDYKATQISYNMVESAINRLYYDIKESYSKRLSYPIVLRNGDYRQLVRSAQDKMSNLLQLGVHVTPRKMAMFSKIIEAYSPNSKKPSSVQLEGEQLEKRDLVSQLLSQYVRALEEHEKFTKVEKRMTPKAFLERMSSSIPLWSMEPYDGKFLAKYQQDFLILLEQSLSFAAFAQEIPGYNFNDVWQTALNLCQLRDPKRYYEQDNNIIAKDEPELVAQCMRALSNICKRKDHMLLMRYTAAWSTIDEASKSGKNITRKAGDINALRTFVQQIQQSPDLILSIVYALDHQIGKVEGPQALWRIMKSIAITPQSQQQVILESLNHILRNKFNQKLDEVTGKWRGGQRLIAPVLTKAGNETFEELKVRQVAAISDNVDRCLALLLKLPKEQITNLQPLLTMPGCTTLSADEMSALLRGLVENQPDINEKLKSHLIKLYTRDITKFKYDDQVASALRTELSQYLYLQDNPLGRQLTLTETKKWEFDYQAIMTIGAGDRGSDIIAGNTKNIESISDYEFQMLLQQYKKLYQTGATKADKDRGRRGIIAAICAAMDRSSGKFPRPAQTLSLMMSTDLDNPDTNIFHQMQTGWGKTIVIAMHAAFFALTNDYIDISTSSYELAARDAASMHNFYARLGLQCALNPVTPLGTTTEEYKAAQVHYGASNDLILFDLNQRQQGRDLPTDRILLADEMDQALHSPIKSRLAQPMAMKSRYSQSWEQLLEYITDFVDVGQENGSTANKLYNYGDKNAVAKKGDHANLLAYLEKILLAQRELANKAKKERKPGWRKLFYEYDILQDIFNLAESLSDETIATLLTAAHNSRKTSQEWHAGEHYYSVPERQLRFINGIPQMVLAYRLVPIVNHQFNKNSRNTTFSRGMQPFLHVRFNRHERELKNARQTSNPKYYIVEGLNETVAIDSPQERLFGYGPKLKTFGYKRVIGSSATVGNYAEKSELQQEQKMVIISHPAHRAMPKRPLLEELKLLQGRSNSHATFNKFLLLADSVDDQVDLVIKLALTQREQDRPAKSKLLLCDDEAQIDEVYQKLEQRIANDPQLQQLFHGIQTYAKGPVKDYDPSTGKMVSVDEERYKVLSQTLKSKSLKNRDNKEKSLHAKVVKQASIRGVVTIGAIGSMDRGTDVIKSGDNDLDTIILGCRNLTPSDVVQGAGRTWGRFENGSAGAIPTKAQVALELKTHGFDIAESAINTDHFFKLLELNANKHKNSRDRDSRYYKVWHRLQHHTHELMSVSTPALQEKIATVNVSLNEKLSNKWPAWAEGDADYTKHHGSFERYADQEWDLLVKAAMSKVVLNTSEEEVINCKLQELSQLDTEYEQARQAKNIQSPPVEFLAQPNGLSISKVITAPYFANNYIINKLGGNLLHYASGKHISYRTGAQISNRFFYFSVTATLLLFTPYLISLTSCTYLSTISANGVLQELAAQIPGPLTNPLLGAFDYNKLLFMGVIGAIIGGFIGSLTQSSSEENIQGQLRSWGYYTAPLLSSVGSGAIAGLMHGVQQYLLQYGLETIIAKYCASSVLDTPEVALSILILSHIISAALSTAEYSCAQSALNWVADRHTQYNIDIPEYLK